ncbi:hypothetical protein I302_108804 [Kwoniella bestiolae CBS 10118]|uniref:Wax synthase domain-containing protein n=1 Tax=Kwoniella bestiolae CBS 10118 TaxID=1296100 RepID=A0A1B9FU54_9TREE|nr:hypothetical protein I302_07942 [Kwoniella bestiolae CBS 10118]OCF22296.1 hypothetical protein I302_07942 [Kwoniella bestiolae CBS 10118]
MSPSPTLALPQIPLSPVLSKLPPLHLKNPTDYNLAFGTLSFTVIVLTTPHTGGWKLFRAGIVAPLCIAVFGYLVLCTEDEHDFNHWGVATLMGSFIMRILEFFIFFPPEENCHRLVPRSQGHSPSHESKLKSPQSQEEVVLIPEPVPPPFTLAKFYWSFSLWFSYRGIGWNTSCPLGASSRRDPYLRTSSRTHFVMVQMRKWILAYLVDDFFRAIRNIHSASFFSGLPGAVPYHQLSQFERGINSTAVVVRIYFSLVNSHIAMSIICVIIGGLLGWETEMYAPWGWPPLFGDLDELWRYPGLSTLWSRTWQGYNRRWLYVLGWIGIGENLLGLTHTGISSHPSVPPTSKTTLASGSFDSSSRNSPNPSGQISPSHPLPSSAIPNSDSPIIRRKMSTKLMVQNLIKSFITFLLSGIIHDVGSLALLLKNRSSGDTIYLNDVLRLTPFFIVQPFALAIEALIKTCWRTWKSRKHPSWKRGKGGEPGWLVTTERLIGFIWTWVWLGFTARPFVEGMAQLGAYRRDGGRELFWSFWGGVIWGKWYI